MRLAALLLLAGVAAATGCTDSRCPGPQCADNPPDATPDGGAPADGGTPDGCEIRFTYPAGGAQGVELRGDFKEDGWNSGLAMAREGDRFAASVTAGHRQTIAYKFVVDGSQWTADPDNPVRASDGFGGEHSVRYVECAGAAERPAPTDWRDGVMYFVLVDRFLDGDASNNAPVTGVEHAANYQGGDLAGVLARLRDGYFNRLGVNVLWLSSPVDNGDGAGAGDDGHSYSAYHGYWPARLDEVERQVGDLALLRTVVDEAHARGLRIVLDYVMNHVHESSPVFQQHPDWFWPLQMDGHGCVCGNGCSWDDDSTRRRCWFAPYLPDFNFTVAAARQFSVDNALWWAEQTGADGFRLDAVKHIETSWVTDLRSRLSSLGGRDAPFYLVGETFASDRGLLRSYVDPATMLDGQFDFPLRAAVASVVLGRRGSMRDLGSFAADNDNFYGKNAVMGTFIGNHDLPRVIHLAENSPQFGEWDGGRNRGWANQPQSPQGREAYERVVLAQTFLMTSPGVPLVYYGDEIGLPGGGDPDNRRFMQWSGVSPHQEWLRSRFARLADIRAQHPALRRGTRTVFPSTHGDVLVYRMETTGDSVWVVLNRGDSPVLVEGVPSGAYADLLGGGVVAMPQTLPARRALVLVKK